MTASVEMRREEEDRVLQRLEEWEQREGQLPNLIEAYRQLLIIQRQARSRLSAPQLTLIKAFAERGPQGAPLLSFQELALDWVQVGNLVREIADLVTEDSAEAKNEVQALRDIASDVTLLEDVVRLWYEGASLAATAAAQHVDDQLLSFVIGLALKPFLSAYSEALLPTVNQDLWRRRYCPICGGKPDFAFLDRERGARWLLCSRCDAEWLFQRLGCPYCGNQKLDSLAYFTNDDRRYRLYVCEECRSYIKAIDLRHAPSDVILPLERILTLDMDRQAQEAGYKKVL